MRTDLANGPDRRPHRRRYSILAALGACLVLLSAAPARAFPWDRFEVGLWPEVTLVGLAGGARAELAWRPFGPGTSTRLRLAPGFLEGPEFHYVPIALGYRAVLRPTARIRPVLGTGVEYQARWVGAGAGESAQQLAWYFELGLHVAVRSDVSVGLMGGVDWTFYGGPGPGIVVRVGVTWSPGDRPGVLRW